MKFSNIVNWLLLLVMEVKDANPNILQALLQHYKTELATAVRQGKNRFERAKLKTLVAELRDLLRQKQGSYLRQKALGLAAFTITF